MPQLTVRTFVRLSIRHNRNSINTVKTITTQLTPLYIPPGTTFCCRISWRNSDEITPTR